MWWIAFQSIMRLFRKSKTGIELANDYSNQRLYYHRANRGKNFLQDMFQDSMIGIVLPTEKVRWKLWFNWVKHQSTQIVTPHGLIKMIGDITKDGQEVSNCRYEDRSVWIRLNFMTPERFGEWSNHKLKKPDLLSLHNPNHHVSSFEVGQW